MPDLRRLARLERAQLAAQRVPDPDLAHGLLMLFAGRRAAAGRSRRPRRRITSGSPMGDGNATGGGHRSAAPGTHLAPRAAPPARRGGLPLPARATWAPSPASTPPSRSAWATSGGPGRSGRAASAARSGPRRRASPTSSSAPTPRPGSRCARGGSRGSTPSRSAASTPAATSTWRSASRASSGSPAAARRCSA